MAPARYLLSLRRDEVGGPVTSPILYAVGGDPGAPTNGVDKFDVQLRSGQLQRQDVEFNNPILRYGRVLFIAHGFNTSRSRGMWSGEELGRQDLNYECVVACLWPGDSHIGGAIYPFVLGDARDAGDRLATFLARLSMRADIDFVTHSFGVRVVLQAVRRLIDAQPERRLGQAVFMGSAADESILEWREYKKGLEAFARVLVLSSTEDSTLKDLYPKGDWVEDQFYRSERGRHRALGRYGPLRAPDSVLNPKLEHVEIDRRYEQDHNNYMPWPWDKGLATGGWEPKRVRVRTALEERSRNKALSDPAMLTPPDRFGDIPQN
jgi:hypothetical protein